MNKEEVKAKYLVNTILNADVVIEVYGGVADVTKCREGIKVIIIDHDNEEEE